MGEVRYCGIFIHASMGEIFEQGLNVLGDLVPNLVLEGRGNTKKENWPTWVKELTRSGKYTFLTERKTSFSTDNFRGFLPRKLSQAYVDYLGKEGVIFIPVVSTTEVNTITDILIEVLHDLFGASIKKIELLYGESFKDFYRTVITDSTSISWCYS